ncbi:hypothetical protein [Alloscardovia sp. HMSC034E08]|uniref:hypothetical protein n=1 Tax=Alloscardovia sp. HMSC034E08 TaxID=1739413 RepID=UPI001FEFD01E|nr:hypothetical protein [Alloscardovia sp. HMSC034E08]
MNLKISIENNDPIRVNDVVETINHFRATDYCINVAEEPLTEDIIEQMHYVLKRGTSDESLPFTLVSRR